MIIIGKIFHFSRCNHHTNKRLLSGLVAFIGIVFCCSFSTGLFAQQMPFPPPNQLQVYVVQDLNFGSFTTGSGGSVIISPSGIRSATGNVFLMGSAAYQAIFNVRLIPGRLIHIQLGPPIQLYRVGGGGQVTMEIGPTDKPNNQFVTTGGHPFINPVSVGGVLTVGDNTSNPAGAYQGNFSVTFIQE